MTMNMMFDQVANKSVNTLSNECAVSVRRMMYRAGSLQIRFSVLFVLTLAAGAAVQKAAAMPPIEEEPIRYGSQKVNDPVAKLQGRIDRGETVLDHEEKHSYLRAILRELNVPLSSQVLVFSKTSLQLRHIYPRSPRAIFFGDDVYVGWVRNGEVLEFSAMDPRQGAIFYTLSVEKTKRPKFRRHTHECLMCHGSSQTRGVPGHLVRSVYPDAKGFPVLSEGTFRTDHRSPLKERWGGWYVTGTHGRQVHMGNTVMRDKRDPSTFSTSAGTNLTDLSGFFNTAAYPTPHSDLVALMVFEHQARMQNLITYANYQARLAARDEAVINRMLKRPEKYRSVSTQRRYDNAAKKLVECLLFRDEIRLTGPVRGTSRFADEFAKRGPFDSQKRSLRTLDLKHRLFKYPCSFLIYSEAFDALPENVKTSVYRQLWDVLSGANQSERFSHLSKADRRAIVDILRSTKTGLPKYFLAKPKKASEAISRLSQSPR